jgi:signal transduction histidine kinase
LIPHLEALASEGNKKIIMALLTGMILLLIIFNFYLFSLSKQKVYLLYILYTAGGWFWILTNAGYGYEYFWPNVPWFASKARVFFVVAATAFSLLFLVAYIGNINQKKLNIVRGFNIFLFVVIVLTLITKPDGYEGVWWFYAQHSPPIIAAMHSVITSWLLLSEIRRKNTLAMFYLAAMGSLLIAVILQITFSVGGFNGFGNFFGHFGVSVGFIAEAVILTAGLAHRFNQHRLDKEKMLTEMNKRQHENTRILIEVQEIERNQVALQLHDVAGSLLSAAKLNLSSLLEEGVIIDKKANLQATKAEEAVSQVSEMVRNLSHALSPVMLEQVGFKTTVEKVVSIFNASGKINIQLVVIGFSEYVPAFNNHYTALYSIIYELLNNIVKHSFASKALLQIAEYDDCFSIMAEDDGIGIEPDKIAKNRSMGIAAIQSKINYFGGRIAFDNIEPSGLLITIEIPVIND